MLLPGRVGGWLAANEIPRTRSWGRMPSSRENENALRATSRRRSRQSARTDQHEIGDYYEACWTRPRSRLRAREHQAVIATIRKVKDRSPGSAVVGCTGSGSASAGGRSSSRPKGLDTQRVYRDFPGGWTADRTTTARPKFKEGRGVLAKREIRAIACPRRRRDRRRRRAAIETRARKYEDRGERRTSGDVQPLTQAA